MSQRVQFRGFSLIELLVVLGIVALLLAILLPTISTVRLRMTNTTCMNNLRQLGMALNAYRADHQKWPKATFIPNPFEVLNPDLAPPIYEPLSRYLAANSKVYRCPADQRVWEATAAASANGYGVSYSYVIWDGIDILSREQKTNFPIMSDLAAASMTWRVDPPHPKRMVNRVHKDGSVDSYQVGG